MLKDFTKEKFDIIIQAGQSNSEGCGMGPVSAPYETNANVWYLNNDFTISMAQERIWGNEIAGDFSLSFAREYIKSGKLASGRKVLIIRAAVGGTGFSDKRWGLTDDLYLRMMDMIGTALALNPENRPVAFLWHQGETDAILNATYDMHYSNLITLINTVRTACKCPDLPFVAGDFVSHWKNDNLAICEPVVAAIKAVCADIGNGEFVETAELQSNDQKIRNSDTIHFSREALFLLGAKYYSAIQKYL